MLLVSAVYMDRLKMLYIYTMEYYSAIKSNETESFAETWMDLETVKQSEASQKGKNKYCILMHICELLSFLQFILITIKYLFRKEKKKKLPYLRT